MMYDSWDIMHNRVFVILGHFLPFDPPKNLKNQNFEKMTKKPEDIIILHLHTTNDNHTMYGSWEMEHERQNFLSFWINFCPFIFCPFNNLENQNFEKLQRIPVDIVTLHKCTRNENHMMYVVREIWSATDIIFCHFGPFFALLPP